MTPVTRPRAAGSFSSALAHALAVPRPRNHCSHRRVRLQERPRPRSGRPRADRHIPGRGHRGTGRGHESEAALRDRRRRRQQHSDHPPFARADHSLRGRTLRQPDRRRFDRQRRAVVHPPVQSAGRRTGPEPRLPARGSGLPAHRLPRRPETQPSTCSPTASSKPPATSPASARRRSSSRGRRRAACGRRRSSSADRLTGRISARASRIRRQRRRVDAHRTRARSKLLLWAPGTHQTVLSDRRPQHRERESGCGGEHQPVRLGGVRRHRRRLARQPRPRPRSYRKLPKPRRAVRMPPR